MDHKVELLAPAGSYESLVAAIAAGADAVYIGGNRFGARAYADNLDQEKMLEAIDYAHLHGASIYMTVNTLLKESEMQELSEYLRPYYCHGIDAVIVQDLGVLSVIKTQFPDLAVHASTQMTITGYHGARMLKEMGASRIVTARELSLDEIAEIHQNVDIEIESFVHGALCYGYSGQCLMSSLIGGRSGNRGRCAQTCRLAYDVKRDGKTLNPKKEQHLLSLKDLCTLDILPDIIDAGVYSLKIEGRMKSPRYTAGVVSIYRKYLDRYEKAGRKDYHVDPQDKEFLLDLFDRGGFTDGFYQRDSGRSMVSLTEKPSFRKGNEALFQYLDDTFVNQKQQQPINGKIILKADQPIKFIVWQGDVSIEIFGEMLQPALKRPAEEIQIRKQLEKTGNTPFYFETLEIIIEGAFFVPIQQLNELRRNGLAMLTEAILKPYRRSPLQSSSDMTEKAKDSVTASSIKIHVSLESQDGFLAAVGHQAVSEIYIDSIGYDAKTWKKTVETCHNHPAKKKCFLVFPHIFRKKAEDYFNNHIVLLKNAGFDGIVVRNMEEIDYIREHQIDLPMIFDYPLYTFNKQAKDMMKHLGGRRLTLPVELNSREIAQLDGSDMELVAYGYLPMMVSASCLAKTVEGCHKKEELLYLKDRKGKEMPVKNNCRFCYNTIYNSSPVWLADQRLLVEQINPLSIRLSFTVEDAREVKRVIDCYADTFLYGSNSEAAKYHKDFTRGHLKRGIE